nr:histidine phosphatase family protein [Tenuibacillus multivorans]
MTSPNRLVNRRVFFTEVEIDQIISSPYTRAIQSIIPTTEEKGLNILVHQHLKERILSQEKLYNWMEYLKQSFKDVHQELPGGESSFEATQRFLTLLMISI